MSDQPAGWVFTKQARRDMRRLDRPAAQRIVQALDRLCGDPPQGDVVKLTGIENEWRLRVGDWRVRFIREGSGPIQVTAVLPRGRAYRD